MIAIRNKGVSSDSIAKYRVLSYASCSFNINTDTYSYPGIQVYTPAGGRYTVTGGGSKVCPSGSMILVSSTTPAYTPLSDSATDDSLTGYLVVATISGFNYARSGIVIVGVNWVDNWLTQYNTLDPCHWINKTTKTTADTATTNLAAFEAESLVITNEIRNSRWNNIGANAGALGGFISKLRAREVGANNLLTLVCWGDSIFGKMEGSEMTEASNNTNSPPGMYRNNIARKILDNFQIPESDLKYYPVKNMTGFVGQDTYYPSAPTTYPPNSSFATFSGTWIEYANNDFHYYRETSSATASVTIELEAGFSKANLIAQRSSGGCDNVDVTVSVNGGAFGTVSAASITGGESFSLLRANADYSTGDFQRQYRVEFSGLNTANTYTFKFTQNGTGSFIVWGMEAWETASLRVINAGRGTKTMSVLKNFLYDDIINTNYKPDAVIFELTMLNDSYWGGGTPTFAQETSTLDNLDLVLRKITESGIPLLCILPHPASTEAGHYAKYIQFARTYCAKYGIAAIDMYAKWKELVLDGRSDGTHLNDAGVTYYYEEIEKVLKADRPCGSIVKKSPQIQSGLLASVGSITFDTPYLTAPNVAITPVKDGGVVPDLYLDGNPTTTGFTVAGTGKFNWESKIL